MSIQQLPPSTVNLITSTQIITSVSSAVKELIENSLDAGALNIDVKLDNNGLDRLEVKDDGCGISPSNAALMALPHFTSKISSFSDIELLESYGFRGEALNALCQVGNVTVTTGTSNDTVGMIYVLDRNGQVTSSKPTQKVKGTTIVVTNIFKNLPVRRQFVSNGRRAKEELRLVETTVKMLAIINLQVRFTLSHNKCLIWQKTAGSQLRQGVVHMLGYTPARELYELTLETSEVKMEALVPRKNCDIGILSKSSPDCGMVFINRRPVRHKGIVKVVNECIRQHFDERSLHKKNPIFVISLVLNPSIIDINLEPNKTRVLLKDEDSLMENMRTLLDKYYGPAIASKTGKESSESPAKKRKLDVSENLPLVSGSEGPQYERGGLFEESGASCSKSSTLSARYAPTIRPHCHENDSSTVEPVDPSNKENISMLTTPTEKTLQSVVKPSWITDPDRSVDPEKWSMGQIKGPGGNFAQGSAVLIPSAAAVPVIPNVDSAIPAAPMEMREIAPRIDNEIQKIEPRRDNENPKQMVSAVENPRIEADWDFSVIREPVAEKLRPARSPPRQRHEKHQRKQRPPSPTEDNLDFSLMSVSSQMGRKEMSAFTKFSRDARPQIILENPGISFTRVAVMLASRWKELSSADREVYEQKAREHSTARKAHFVPDERQPKLSFERKEKSQAPLRNAVVHSNATKDEVPCKVEFQQLDISVGLIRERLRAGNSEKHRSVVGDVAIVAQLEPSGGWVCLRDGRHFCLVSPYRLQEVVLAHRLLSTYAMPLTPLPSFQRLDENLLGTDDWNTLLTLERSVCDLDGRTMVITSPVIVKNGFRIQVSQDEESCNVLLTHVASTISYYGIQDLKETLNLAAREGSNNLSSCRPLRVINHIKSEAVRICRQDPAIMDRPVLQKLLQYWKTHLPSSEYCLHSKQIWTNIHTRIDSEHS